MIAIGHLDNLFLPECESPYEPDLSDLKDRLRKSHENNNRKKGYTTNHFNQVKNFISDLKIGDWVVIKDDQNILIGRVTGYPRISRKSLDIGNEHHHEMTHALNFNLRRKVNWGPSLGCIPTLR